MRIFKQIRLLRYLKYIRFFVLLIIANVMLSFLLEPVDGASGVMWKEYYQEDDLDTVFVGSSVCGSIMDPYVFNEVMGVNSFNMGTPSQAVPQTIQSIEEAIKDHDIKTVVFAMNFSTLKYSVFEEAELTFQKARVRNIGGVDALKESIAFMFSEDVRDTEKSVNFLFPWIYNRVELSFSSIAENVKQKVMDRKSKDDIQDTAISYKGFQNTSDTLFNYDNRWENTSNIRYSASFDEEMLEEFENLLVLCNEKKVDLIVVATPHPPYDVIACMDSYEENGKTLSELCSSYGVDFYDFSLAKAEAYEPTLENFCDNEHLNLEGAQDFSRQLAEFIVSRNRGENVEEHFYTFEEYLNVHSELVEEWKIRNAKL